MEVMVEGPKCLWVPVPIFLPYICIKMQCKNIYDTMKYKKMNDGIFNFYASTVNISLWVFTLQ